MHCYDNLLGTGSCFSGAGCNDGGTGRTRREAFEESPSGVCRSTDTTGPRTASHGLPSAAGGVAGFRSVAEAVANARGSFVSAGTSICGDSPDCAGVRLSRRAGMVVATTVGAAAVCPPLLWFRRDSVIK